MAYDVPMFLLSDFLLGDFQYADKPDMTYQALGRYLSGFGFREVSGAEGIWRYGLLQKFAITNHSPHFHASENTARTKPLNPTLDFFFKTFFSGKDEDSREALRLLTFKDLLSS
jgi:hypothetical protein